MAHVLIMPRQGNTVESCVIVDWKAKEGEEVAADTPICEVETDKATFEVPAGAEGTLLKIVHPAGDDVPVLEAIAVIGKPGEDWRAAVGSSSAPVSASAPTAAPVQAGEHAQAGESSPAAAPVQAAAPAATSQAAATGMAGSPASPRARNLAAKEAVDVSGLAGSGPGGRVIERDVKAALEGRPALTAAAKALAAGTGTVPAAGSGLGGRATAADMATGSATPAAAIREAGSGEFPGAYTETPIKGIRKLIADRMMESLASMAQFTLNASASAVRMQELRARMKGSNDELGLSRVTINDLILFAVSRVLPKYPYMNAHKANGVLRTFERVHLGIAVDTPRGLMVPVIRNADLLTLEQISAEAKRLAGACQGGSIKSEELSGSTFTVTNLGSLGIESFTPVINNPEVAILGSLGIESFTPVINNPEVAILGVCGIEPKPVIDEEADCDSCGGVSFVPHIGFSLTIDHSVVDGAPAARFLKAFREAIADIDLWLAK